MPTVRSSHSMLLVGACLWILLAASPPILNQTDFSDFSPSGYAFFASLCHQLPERSFQIWGAPWAVCARCLGLYVGFLIGLLLFPRLPRLANGLLNRPRLLLLFVLPMTVDLLVDNSRMSRFLSGSIASFPIALFVWIGTEQLRSSQFWRKDS